MIKKYLALGDSYTIGEGLEKGHRFPDHLVQLLGSEFAEPEIVAVTGWTTGELLEAISNRSLHANFDLVTLLIGVNNQYRGQTLEQYADEFSTLLELAVGFAGSKPHHVIVVSIPDWGRTPFAMDRDPEKIGLEIDQFNKLNHEISAQSGVHYVDITGLSRAQNLDVMLVSDKLHYSGSMYELWAGKIYREVFTK